MTDADKNVLIIETHMFKNLDELGEKAVEKIKLLFEGSTNSGKSSKIVGGITYKIVGNEVHIVSESPVPKFIDKGTKPYTIRPKNGKTLKFRVLENVVGKNGHTFKTGDWVATKEVKHPGIKKREFVSNALHLLKNDITKILTK